MFGVMCFSFKLEQILIAAIFISLYESNEG